jgi:S-adenosyl methyltransferase
VNRTGDADRWAARELAVRLGGLPLALEQAAAYMQATGITAAGYLPLFRERQADMLARGEVAGHPADVAATLGLALSRLAYHAPAAAGLLQLLAFLASEPIPLKLLLASQQAAGLLSPEVEDTIGPLLGEPVTAGDAITALRRYSLIAPAGNGLVLVHRLVQAITRAQLTAEEASQWEPAAAALVEAAIPADPQAPAARPACAVLLPHARAVLGPASGGMRRIARYLQEIDTSVPNPARAWNYLLGGRDNFAADRRAADQLMAVAPRMSAAALASRAFHRRAVRYLAAEAGVRQFLDIGCGLPAPGDTHEIAQAVDPACKIVYVDNDPVVVSHRRALLTGTPHHVVTYLDADARDIDAVLDGARQTLDFSQPVAVMLMAVLAFIEDHALARSVVADLAAVVPSGSYFAIRHAASDLDPALHAAARQWNATGAQHLTLRGEPEVARLIEGLNLIDPGLVTVTEWRPDLSSVPGYDVDEPDTVVPIYGLVARKL